MEFLLNTIRKIDNDQVKEYTFGTEQSLEENLAICFINPKDFDKLNLVSSLHLKISNKEKHIIVKVEKDENVPEGTVTMPVSIWSNVFDPFNNIEGDAKDILIEEGKVVDKFASSSDVKEIDAKGKTVIPAAVEIHAHVASQQLNWVRLLGTNDF
jgi:formylmethanofuran dehydrogenase subunit D